MTKSHRILTICHGHPDFNRGGAEVAAYNLYQEYKAHKDVAASVYLARHDRGRGVTGSIVLMRPDEYLWEQSISDWFRLETAHNQGMLVRFREFLEVYQPTLVHVHHYIHFGMEMFQVIRNACHNSKIILTLHEYVAICANQGQMIKPHTHQLCSRESIEDCVMCFPERTQEDFWLRKHRLQSYLKVVDHFVSPSKFLQQRYMSWGIPAEKISVIENCHRGSSTLRERPLHNGGIRNRFGFFGQVTPYKGLDVLLNAVASLREEEQRKLVLEINGANLEKQTPEFQARINAAITSLQSTGVVQWKGSYEPHQLASRIASVDWVLVPSIWWENSPMIIQEAFTFGRPVICSDIGGMAEKVRDGIDGIHVETGSMVAWADVLRRVLSNGLTQWEELRAGIRQPVSGRQTANSHLDLVVGGVDLVS